MGPQLTEAQNEAPEARPHNDDAAVLALVTGKRGVAGPRVKTIFFDFIAGIGGGLMIFAYSVSYAALIFQGNFAASASYLIWGFMISAAVVGLVGGSLTTLRPVGYAPDSVAVALLVPLAASVAGSVKAGGGSGADIVANVLIALWLTGVLSYASMWVLGYFEVARLARFVPYSAVAGFLSATGVLLIMAGLSLATGHAFGGSILAGDMTLASVEKLCASVAISVIFILLKMHRRDERLFFVAGSLAAFAVLVLVHLTASSGERSVLFLEVGGQIRSWVPFQTLFGSGIHWRTMALHLLEILAVVIVIQISMVVKVSTVEVMNAQASDLDAEFRYNGAGALAASLFGGVGAGISSGVTGVLANAGSRTRLSGLLAAAFAGLALLLHIDIADVFPIPVLAALALYLGFVLLVDSFRQPWLQRAWFDLGAALAIMLICLRFGPMAGVVSGIVVACIVFSYSYARISPIKRHATAASVSSHVEREKEQAWLLRRYGDAIHVYWVSGYLFFGSSDRLLEEVRRRLDVQGSKVEYIVLDMAGVPGMDSSAVVSLIKLQNLCVERGARLACCGLKDSISNTLRIAGVLSFLAFASRNEALAWCEAELLSKQMSPAPSSDPLAGWLAQELGAEAAKAIASYLQRKAVKEGEILYHQSDRAETIDLVAEGSVAIVLRLDDGSLHQLRVMQTQTVVGEMGFFRDALRTASVVAAENSILYSLTLEAFERLERERPNVANSFLQFIIRTLANRLDFANRESTTLL